MKAFKVNRNQQDYYRVDLSPRLFLDGKRRSVMAKPRREALEKAEALIAKRKSGLNLDRAKATVAEFLTRFLDYYQTEGGVALRTWQDCRYHIETNIVPAIGTLPLGEPEAATSGRVAPRSARARLLPRLNFSGTLRTEWLRWQPA